jgi:hypothetical protein
LLLQLLRLLLEHADVGHHLHFAARLRCGRAGADRQQGADRQCPRRQSEG